ncbi:MAG: hypothetical protein ACJAWV_001951 [Flammeovirgaceae bacterium]|jgi:hypothetical protein
MLFMKKLANAQLFPSKCPFTILAFAFPIEFSNSAKLAVLILVRGKS